MKIRAYQIFSNWIFVAAVLGPLVGISLFPLLLVALPFGAVYIARNRSEPWWKLLYVIVTHVFPFFWTTCLLDPRTLSWNVGLFCCYLIVLNITGADMITVYSTMFREHHDSVADFIEERSGLKPMKI